MAGKVTVGVALHQPCFTDFMVSIPFYKLNGLETEMSNAPTLQRGTTPFAFTRYYASAVNL